MQVAGGMVCVEEIETVSGLGVEEATVVGDSA